MTIKKITLPDVGGATDVEVIEVLVKPGDQVKKESLLVTLESDKASMDLPSPEEGIVKEVKVKVGDRIKQGEEVIVLETGGEQKPDVQEKTESLKPSEKKQAENKSKEIAKEPEKEPIDQSEIHAGPIVRRIAREFGIDLTKIRPSGPKDRVLKEDVQNYVKNRLSEAGGSGMGFFPQAPNVDFSQFGQIEIQPLSRIQKISGKNLHRNWLLVPHVTQFGEADVTELESFRQSQKSTADAANVKLTPLAFMMKAVVTALKAFPKFNASLDPNGEQLILKKYFHIGVAVDTPNGLVVPVIRDVDQKGLIDLARELGTISEKARNKQLTPNEMQGGSFSISSLGGIGGTAFTPIINVPEVAILGVSKSSYKPIYQEGEFIPRLMMPLSLSYDHRVIDGAEGARFMVFLTNVLSDIRNLLL